MIKIEASRSLISFLYGCVDCHLDWNLPCGIHRLTGQGLSFPWFLTSTGEGCLWQPCELVQWIGEVNSIENKKERQMYRTLQWSFTHMVFLIMIRSFLRTLPVSCYSISSMKAHWVVLFEMFLTGGTGISSVLFHLDLRKKVERISGSLATFYVWFFWV